MVYTTAIITLISFPQEDITALTKHLSKATAGSDACGPWLFDFVGVRVRTHVRGELCANLLSGVPKSKRVRMSKCSMGPVGSNLSISVKPLAMVQVMKLRARSVNSTFDGSQHGLAHESSRQLCICTSGAVIAIT